MEPQDVITTSRGPCPWEEQRAAAAVETGGQGKTIPSGKNSDQSASTAAPLMLSQYQKDFPPPPCPRRCVPACPAISGQYWTLPSGESGFVAHISGENVSATCCVFGSQDRAQNSATRGLPCLVPPGSQAQQKPIWKTELDKRLTIEISIRGNFESSLFGQIKDKIISGMLFCIVDRHQFQSIHEMYIFNGQKEGTAPRIGYRTAYMKNFQVCSPVLLQS